MTAKAEVEVAEASLRSARGVLRGSQSQVEEAERDLSRAELRAPFSGGVAERSIEPFQEVGANTPFLALNPDEVMATRWVRFVCT